MLAAAAVLTAAGLIAGTGLPAQATPVAVPAANTAAKVTINKITTKRASAGKKAVVKPVVRSSGNVKVSSKTLTVRQGSKTLARNVGQARLKAGKYSVTTTVKYKTWSTKPVTKQVKSTRLVSDGSKQVALNCRVVHSVSMQIEASDLHPSMTGKLDAQALVLDCTGGFNGTYETTAVHFPDTAANAALGFAGITGWQESPDELTVTPVVGAKFTASGYPFEKLYKTVTTTKTYKQKIWSGTKTKTLKQSLVVRKG